MSAPASSNSSSTSARYVTFIRHQGNDFAKKIEALIHNEREGRRTHKYQPVREFPEHASVCDMFLVVGAPPRKPPTFQSLEPTAGQSLQLFGSTSFMLATPGTPLSLSKSRSTFKPKPHTDTVSQGPKTATTTTSTLPGGGGGRGGKPKEGRARSYSTGEPNIAFHPKVLFKYPLEKEIDINGITYMCFPDGEVPQRVIKKHGSNNVLLRDHRSPENSFVFLVTGNAKIQYGICVYKEVVAYQTEAQAYVQPLCFCIISSLPFFHFHVDSLMSILDMPHITDLHLISPSRLDSLLKDVLDAYVSQTDVPPCESPEGSPPLPQSPMPSEDDINEFEVSTRTEESNSTDNPSENTSTECGSDPHIDSPEDADHKKALLSVVRYCNLKLPPSRGPLVYFNITMPSVNNNNNTKQSKHTSKILTVTYCCCSLLNVYISP